MTFLKNFKAQNKIQAFLYLMGTEIVRFCQNMSLWQPFKDCFQWLQYLWWVHFEGSPQGQIAPKSKNVIAHQMANYKTIMLNTENIQKSNMAPKLWGFEDKSLKIRASR